MALGHWVGRGDGAIMRAHVPRKRSVLYDTIQQRLGRLTGSGIHALLRESRIGLEKESLRVNSEGSLALTPHPAALGSPLTHPWITTDYAEPLLELITPPMATFAEALGFLRDVQRFVYPRIGEEILWATSMPCVVRGESSIPLARYGSSNAGTMKTVYRRGLGYRYGRVMQVIAGIHFNYSFGQAFWAGLQSLEGNGVPLREFIDTRYFALLRNLQRLGWLVPYLFGASPAVCKSFLCGQPNRLQQFDPGTYYEPWATSLRMGDIGYQNNQENKRGIKANYDSLEAYVESLRCAIETPCPEYEAIGVKVDGKYRQLNGNILQIENEYYSTVRPKQVPIGNEKPTLALTRRGVAYFELRSLDVNAFDPLGVNEEQLYFLEALTLFCLLADSPPIDAVERENIDWNEMTTAHCGREPGLKLRRNGAMISLKAWAAEVTGAMEGVCRVLDEVKGPGYLEALRLQQAKVEDPDRTPSARMLREMRENGEAFHAFARRMSLKHQRYFMALPEDADRTREFTGLAASSISDQHAVEAADDIDFDEYLRRYFAQH